MFHLLGISSIFENMFPNVTLLNHTLWNTHVFNDKVHLRQHTLFQHSSPRGFAFQFIREIIYEPDLAAIHAPGFIHLLTLPSQLRDFPLPFEKQFINYSL